MNVEADGGPLQRAVEGRGDVTFTFPANANDVLKKDLRTAEERAAAPAAGYNVLGTRLDPEALSGIPGWLRTCWELSPSRRSFWSGSLAQRDDTGCVCRHDERVENLLPQLTIGFIPSATVEPLIYVYENDSLDHAVALMRMYNFSQLPVLQTKRRSPIGIISWKSVGRALLATRNPDLSQCIDRSAHIVPMTADLISTIEKINEDDCVLVVDENDGISGIVTSADLGDVLADTARPYLLISGCEKALRSVIGAALESGALSSGDVASVTLSARQLFRGDVDELTFGDLVNVLNHERLWACVNYRTDRGELSRQLNLVAQLRNQVMHFRARTDETSAVESRISHIIAELEAVRTALVESR